MSSLLAVPPWVRLEFSQLTFASVLNLSGQLQTVPKINWVDLQVVYPESSLRKVFIHTFWFSILDIYEYVAKLLRVFDLITHYLAKRVQNYVHERAKLQPILIINRSS